MVQDPYTGNIADTGDTFGQPSLLPDGMRIDVERPLGAPTVRTAGAGDTWIDFYPDGRSDVVTVRLTDKQESVTVIACPSPAEPFRVLTPEEAVRR
jgi:hypothetical protein